MNQMREILFRGKRMDNGEWLYGAVAKFRNVSNKIYTAIMPEVDGENSIVSLKRIRSSSVGQYTGLKDKNGKRIFEGDIVQYYERQFDGKNTPVCDAVVYVEGGFAVGAYFLNNWLWDSVHGNVQLRDVEVVGNIYENPELLKGSVE